MSHIWGDDWPHWNDLYAAEDYIYKLVKLFTRCTLVSKEKYGTIRYEYIFPPQGGLCYRSWYKHMWIHSWLYYQWQKLGWRVCAWAIKKATRKWPYLTHELVMDFDYPAYLSKELKKIHDSLWTTLS